MDEDSRKEAERLMSRAQERAASVSTKLFVVAAAIVVLWVNSLEAQKRFVLTVLISHRTIAFLKSVNGVLQKDAPPPWKTVQSDSRRMTPRQRSAWEQRRTAFNAKIDSITKSSSDQTVPFDVFGLKFAA